jgi:cytochrome c peroxidase
METVGMALASYQRTLVSGASPFDRWHYGGEEQALGESARRGFTLFTGRAGCSACHVIGQDAALFTDIQDSSGRNSGGRRVSGRWTLDPALTGHPQYKRRVPPRLRADRQV